MLGAGVEHHLHVGGEHGRPAGPRSPSRRPCGWPAPSSRAPQASSTTPLTYTTWRASGKLAGHDASRRPRAPPCAGPPSRSSSRPGRASLGARGLSVSVSATPADANRPLPGGRVTLPPSRPTAGGGAAREQRAERAGHRRAGRLGRRRPRPAARPSAGPTPPRPAPHQLARRAPAGRRPRARGRRPRRPSLAQERRPPPPRRADLGRERPVHLGRPAERRHRLQQRGAVAPRRPRPARRPAARVDGHDQGRQALGHPLRRGPCAGAGRSSKCWNTDRTDTPARSATRGAVGRRSPSSTMRDAGLDDRLAGPLGPADRPSTGVRRPRRRSVALREVIPQRLPRHAASAGGQPGARGATGEPWWATIRQRPSCRRNRLSAVTVDADTLAEEVLLDGDPGRVAGDHRPARREDELQGWSRRRTGRTTTRPPAPSPCSAASPGGCTTTRRSAPTRRTWRRGRGPRRPRRRHGWRPARRRCRRPRSRRPTLPARMRRPAAARV